MTSVMKKRYVVLVVTLAAAVGGAGFWYGPEESLAADAKVSCGLDCASGPMVGCPAGYHVAWWDGDDPVWSPGEGSHEDTCWIGSCTEKHPLCG